MIIKNKHIPVCPKIILGCSSMLRYRYYVPSSREMTYVYLRWRIFVQKCAQSEITQRILLGGAGTAYPYRTAESVPGFQWGSCCSIFSFLCSVFYFILCSLALFLCCVCFSTIYGCGIFRPFLYVHIDFLVQQSPFSR